MKRIYKFTIAILLVFMVSTVITFVKSLEADLFASGESTAVEPSKRIKKHQIEHFDIANDFYYAQQGKASWYGRRFHNRKTASGERYNMHALSAAHKNLPFGTIIRVTNQDNNKVVLVRVNDRGPFIKSKILDLSVNSVEEIEGTDNPYVSIEALIPNDYMFMNKSDDEYYFGYSYDYPLVCLPSGALKFLDSSTDFEEAVEIYKEYVKNLPGKFLYLMTSANYKKYIPYEDTETTYYIGLFDGNSLQFAEEMK